MTKSDVTTDAFLGGKLQITQPADGFRASTDAVLLAAAVDAKSKDTVLDIGSGVGTSGLCVAFRTGVQLTALEQQEAYANLARENAVENKIEMQVICGDLFDTPAALKDQVFDHVITNPPFFEASDTVAPNDQSKAHAHVTDYALADWITQSLKRLKQGGYFYIIMRAERLDEILSALSPSCGEIRILPIVARAGQPAKRVIIRARKTSKAPLKLLAPFVMHLGAAHEADADSYSPLASAVLRDGEKLDVNWA